MCLPDMHDITGDENERRHGPKKKISVKTLMLLSIFLTVTVGFTATIGFMMWQWMAQQEVLAKNISARLPRCKRCRSANSWILP